MLKLNFYDLGTVDDLLIKRVVIVSFYNNKWVYCKQKGKDTWEIPGGHVEKGETPLDAAKRELYEETGAIEYELEPLCIYKLSCYALLCYAKINLLSNILDSKIEKIAFFDDEPKKLTYPNFHSKLFKVVKKLKNYR